MAYRQNSETKEEVLRIKKNSKGDYLIVQKVTNNTTKALGVDVRQYYTNDLGEISPTTKGIRLSGEVLLEVMTAMTVALESNEVMDLVDHIKDMHPDIFDDEEDFIDSDEDIIEEGDEDSDN